MADSLYFNCGNRPKIISFLNKNLYHQTILQYESESISFPPFSLPGKF